MAKTAKKRATRYDLRDPVQLEALIVALRADKESGTEQVVEGLRRLASPEAGANPVSLQLRRSRGPNEQEGSLRSQVIGAIDVLERLGDRRILLVYVFQDTTGGKLWRRGLLDPVVADARAGLVRELWHLDGSRLGRMPARQIFAYLDALDAAGVRARDLSRPNDDESFGSDIRRMCDADKFHSELLSKAKMTVERFRDRHLERALYMGVTPFGLARAVTRADRPADPPRLVPRGLQFRRAPYELVTFVPDPSDPRSGEVYREMVVMARDEGLGFTEIASRLNARRERTPSGEGEWCMQSVRSILRNPAYCGDARLFHRSVGEYLTLGPDRRPAPVSGEHQTSFRPPEHRLVREGAHVGLVSHDEWQALQRAIAGRGRNRNGRRANQYTLRSQRVLPAVVCAHCQRPMLWRSRYDGLFCSGYKHCGSSVCKNYVAGAGPLAKLLWDAHAKDVKRLLGTTDLNTRLRERVRSLVAERGKKATEAPAVDPADLRRRRRQIEAEAERLAGLSAESLELLDKKLKSLAAEKREIDRVLAESGKPKRKEADLESATDAVMERVEVLFQPYEDVPPEVARAILAVAVRPDSVRLTFARPKHYRQEAIVAKVEADLIDPRDGLGAVAADLALPTSTSCPRIRVRGIGGRFNGAAVR